MVFFFVTSPADKLGYGRAKPQNLLRFLLSYVVYISVVVLCSVDFPSVRVYSQQKIDRKIPKIIYDLPCPPPNVRLLRGRFN